MAAKEYVQLPYNVSALKPWPKSQGPTWRFLLLNYVYTFFGMTQPWHHDNSPRFNWRVENHQPRQKSRLNISTLCYSSHQCTLRAVQNKRGIPQPVHQSISIAARPVELQETWKSVWKCDLKSSKKRTCPLQYLLRVPTAAAVGHHVHETQPALGSAWKQEPVSQSPMPYHCCYRKLHALRNLQIITNWCQARICVNIGLLSCMQTSSSWHVGMLCERHIEISAKHRLSFVA